MVRFSLNVFTGSFSDEQDAFSYVSWNYEADPDNPASEFAREFGVPHFDDDFVETIWGSDRLDYLKSLLVNGSDAALVENVCDANDNTLVVVLEIEGNRDIQFAPAKGNRMRYCGRFPGCFREP